MNKRVFIIAEAGVNHNGDINLAYKMIDEAINCGVDAIKFQTFKSENVVSKYAKMAEYQKLNTKTEESQLEMIKKLELSFNDFIKLKEYCDKKNIVFMSTPFDIESINFLRDLNLNYYKIPSGEINNVPYLMEMSKLDKEIFLSTGMSTLGDVEFALSILDKPNNKIVLLHCNTEYPTPMEDVNLRVLDTYKKAFNLDVGYSDHTKGIEIPIAAVSLGAIAIEKHFTLDKNMVGPDHKASADINELKQMVTAIRNIEIALGDGVKKVTNSEKKNINIARKSIVAKVNILKGEKFTEDNLTCKRPGNGISPSSWYEVIERVATRDFTIDEMIEI